MKYEKETTIAEPAAMVGEASTKERINPHITTGAEQLAGLRLAREREKIDALNLAAMVARNFSFWRRHGEHKAAGRAILHHLCFALGR